MANIVNIAKDIAKDLPGAENGEIPKNVDMGQLIGQITQSVSKVMTPELVQELAGGFTNNNVSKKNKKQVIEELQSDSEDDDDTNLINPRTKDLHFTLNVTLEDLYLGKTKKLAVRRKKIVNGELVEEKKKLSINILPGMLDEQVIVFNKEADEKEGHIPGDIIITLSCAEHSIFEREGNNLIIEKEISLYESYKLDGIINTLDNRQLRINTDNIDIFGEELESLRKIKNEGMPILNSENKGDLIIKFKCKMPKSFDDEQLKLLETLFPKLNILPDESENFNKVNLEVVTESDFELESDSESESESESDSESDSESESNSD